MPCGPSIPKPADSLPHQLAEEGEACDRTGSVEKAFDEAQRPLMISTLNKLATRGFELLDHEHLKACGPPHLVCKAVLPQEQGPGWSAHAHPCSPPGRTGRQERKEKGYTVPAVGDLLVCAAGLQRGPTTFQIQGASSFGPDTRPADSRAECLLAPEIPHDKQHRSQSPGKRRRTQDLCVWNHGTKPDGVRGDPSGRVPGLPRHVGSVQFLPDLSKGFCRHRQAYYNIYL